MWFIAVLSLVQSCSGKALLVRTCRGRIRTGILSLTSPPLSLFSSHFFPPFIKDQMPHWQAGNCFNVIMMSSDLRCISHQRGKEGEGEVRKIIWGKGENKGKRARKWRDRWIYSVLWVLQSLIKLIWAPIGSRCLYAWSWNLLNCCITNGHCCLCRLKSPMKTRQWRSYSSAHAQACCRASCNLLPDVCMWAKASLSTSLLFILSSSSSRSCLLPLPPSLLPPPCLPSFTFWLFFALM